MFIDQAQILAVAGAGGNGCSAMSTPPFSRHARASGGNGGDGGDVVLVADPQLVTLLDFQFRHEFRADRGRHGSGNNKTGRRGADCTIRVPTGTVVIDAKTGRLLRDLVEPGERLVVARGGQGGLGNATLSTLRRTSFAQPVRLRSGLSPERSRRTQGRGEQRRTTTSLPGPPRASAGAGRVASRALRQAQGSSTKGPEHSRGMQSRDANAPKATPGAPGQQRRLRLELKLIADVGIVGFPNAGKSSLLSRISTARPKVAPYPFTTRTPVLGVVSVGEAGSFVACDIPGLIEGAHEGRGLGLQFLRHIERTRLLIHLIDMAAMDGGDPVRNYRQLNEELAAYSSTLATRPQLVVANKMDLPDAQEHLRRFQVQIPEPVSAISCATKAGIAQLVQAVWQRLQGLAPATTTASSPR